MDGIDARAGVITMACTRDRSVLDPALLRPGTAVTLYHLSAHVGRLDKHIEVPLPSLVDRLAIIDVLLSSGRRLKVSTEFKQEFAEAMQGRRCADILFLLNQAARLMAEEQEEAENEAVEEVFVRRALEDFLYKPYFAVCQG